MLAAQLRAGGVGDAPGRPRQRFGVPGRREEGKESREGVPVSRGGLGCAGRARCGCGTVPEIVLQRLVLLCFPLLKVS